MSKLIEQARELEREGNLEVSLTYYEMGLGDKSCPFDVRSDMGRANNKLRKFNEALSCFDNVLIMDQNHIDSLFGKGIAYLGLNKWDESLDSFLKANEIDDTNANCYYYISIILQSNNDDGASEYYSKFRELDNDEFKQIRDYYEFGLIFLKSELELENSDKKINLEEFRRVLESFDINESEIEYYLKTLPYEELNLKVNQLNDLAYIEEEKKIIRDEFLEMGLDDEDIDDLFSMESVEYLKNDIISRTKNNPFPEKTEYINIPLYAPELACKKHIFKELVIEEKFTKRVKNILKEIKNIKEIKYVKNYKLIYEHIKKAIILNEFKHAKYYCSLIDESMISNESFKVNFIYIRGLVLSYLNTDLHKVLGEFELLEKNYPEITKDETYKFNKTNIENDLEKSNKELII